jgi:hypothetical protein
MSSQDLAVLFTSFAMVDGADFLILEMQRIGPLEG